MDKPLMKSTNGHRQTTCHVHVARPRIPNIAQNINQIQCSLKACKQCSLKACKQCSLKACKQVVCESGHV